ncbi:MAG: ribose-phosphate pyrophosphokinase [Deltaproteobacteria bacterium]|nr:ribose-phosphate pyrophosphokinase [Deltaproteobacteria bacterium]
MREDLKIFAGNASRNLASAVAEKLSTPLGKASVTTFMDGETRVEINENVRGADVFIIQSTCYPANTTLMELLVMIDAMKRASAGRVTAVMPYYGYARQDRKAAPRAPITAKLVADLITTAGANRVLSLDLHAAQIQGFFNIPVDNLFAMPVLIDYIKSRYDNRNLVIVSPDTGGVVRARAFGSRLGVNIAIVDKRREGPNESEVMNIIGNVEGRDVLLLDDIIDTAGTVTNAAEALMKAGVRGVSVCCTHPVLSGPAMERLNQSCIEELIVTDTIPLQEIAAKSKRIVVLSVAGLISEALSRIHSNDSVSSLFV